MGATVTAAEAEARVEDAVHGFLVGWGWPMSTRAIRVWIEQHEFPGPKCGRWYNTDVTTRLKALAKRGLVEQIVWPAVANQEGHYWQALDG